MKSSEEKEKRAMISAVRDDASLSTTEKNRRFMEVLLPTLSLPLIIH